MLATDIVNQVFVTAGKWRVKEEKNESTVRSGVSNDVGLIVGLCHVNPTNLLYKYIFFVRRLLKIKYTQIKSPLETSFYKDLPNRDGLFSLDFTVDFFNTSKSGTALASLFFFCYIRTLPTFLCT